MPDIFTQQPFEVAKPKSEAVRIREKHTVDELPQPLDATQAPSRIEDVSVAKNNKSDGDSGTVSHQADNYSSIMRSLPSGGNPFKAFLAKPLQVAFSTQAPDEKVLLLLRQHPVTQLPWIIMGAVAAILPFFFDQISFFSFLPAAYQMAIWIGWYLLLIGFIFESFLKWFFNVYIITDERIIDVDFFSLIYKNISAAKIDKIEDTTAQSAGFLAAMFDYGTVTIQTAAEKREFEFEGVPHPTKVTTLINELILEEEREQIEGRVS